MNSAVWKYNMITRKVNKIFGEISYASVYQNFLNFSPKNLKGTGESLTLERNTTTIISIIANNNKHLSTDGSDWALCFTLTISADCHSLHELFWHEMWKVRLTMNELVVVKLRLLGMRLQGLPSKTTLYPVSGDLVLGVQSLELSCFYYFFKSWKCWIALHNIYICFDITSFKTLSVTKKYFHLSI